MSFSDPRQSAPPPDAGAVVSVAVVAQDGSRLGRILDAVAGQSYEVAWIGVVGGGPAVRAPVEERECAWFDGMSDLIAALPPEVTHIWLVHEDVLPRRNALEALVVDSGRVDASVAGSKLLRADHPDLLESVGGATDVFCVPYYGLDVDEKDQEQYDVVRDVAFVSASILIRRDLVRGLGGTDPRMAPDAAGIDLSQRARVAGGRVVVVPSSEVLHERACAERTPRWREEAGRVRALLKVYRPVTLVWTVPLAFLVGLVTSVATSMLDRRPAVFDFLLAWIWNLLRLPSTLAARRRLRLSRLHGDEELFRYQVRGSAQLRELGDRLTSRIMVPDEEPGRLAGLVERSRAFWQDPGFYATLGGLVLVALAGHAILAGRVPIAGFTLPLGDSAVATLRSYAGGWNTAGLGSPVPLHPSVGLTALVHLLVFSDQQVATAVLTVGVAFFGMVGMVRLLRSLGVGSLARYVAAAALLGGPATRALATAGDWPGLLAVGLAPWAIGTVLRAWPRTLRGRIGYLARAGLFNGLLAAAAPVAAGLALAAALLRGVTSGRWAAVLRAAAATGLAAPFLLPWLNWVSVADIAEQGRAIYFAPSWWALGGVALAALFGLLAGDRETVSLVGWGGVLAAGGALLARTAGLGVGREPAVAGLVATAVGTALVAGAAVDLSGRLGEAALVRRLAGWTAGLAGVVAAVGILLLVPTGRLGFPADRYGTQLDFAQARAEAHGPDRVLIVGSPDELPGESRDGAGFSYRLVPGTGPLFAEAWLPAMRGGDAALAAVLADIAAGENVRSGNSLAPFGIRWVVFTGDIVLPLESQFDMHELPGLEYATFENEVFSPRAVSADGTAWFWERPDYVAAGSTTRPVYVAENHDPRWDATAAEWANEVGGTGGRIGFSGDATNRRLALVAAAVLVLLLAGGIAGREESG